MDHLNTLIATYCTPKDLSPGDYYVREGQYAKTIGFVEHGLLHAYQVNHKGEEITTNFFLPKAFCGSYFSFYRKAPALDYIKALRPTRIHTIGYDTLHELFHSDLHINQMGRLWLEQVCIDKDIRLSKMLKLDAKARYLWFLEAFPKVIEKAPLKLIASYLGMKPESLSRIRREIIS